MRETQEEERRRKKEEYPFVSLTHPNTTRVVCNL
jgi:hypothetical protein